MALLPAGCSWSSQEPGLFRTPAPGPIDPTPTPTAVWTPSDNPRLPVLGAWVWASADGTGTRYRIAVHAVRRVVAATVLDWSVTPLTGPGDRVGAVLPDVPDLGLTRFSEGNLNVVLLDRSHDAALRPLTAVGQGSQQHCLCTPPWVVQRVLRFGVTTLLQAAFPALPRGVDRVDVDITTLPVFPDVPVTPEGEAPFGTDATAAAALARPGTPAGPVVRTPDFAYPSPPGQRLRLGVVSVLAGPGTTSVSWTIESRSDGNEITGITVPPLVATDHDQRYGYAGGYASAPSVVAVDGRRRSPLVARSLTTDLSGLHQQECLCTDLRLWTKGLVRAGTTATVVTDLPALPRGARTVDIAFPGLPVLRDIPVHRITAPTVAAVTEPAPVRTWTFRMEDPQAGWPVDQWPTPVPNPRQLGGYQATVDRLR